jgi:hypothetical protein
MSKFDHLFDDIPMAPSKKGMFDDLIPGVTPSDGGGSGMFEDLVPEANRRQPKSPTAAPAVATADDKWDYLFEDIPMAPSKSVLHEVAYQGVKGFNQGLNELAHLPHTLTKLAYDSTIGAVTGHEYPARRDFLDDYLKRGDEPERAVGRYANQAGQAVGASVVPAVGFAARAPAIVRSYQAAAPTTAAGRVVQEAATHAAAAPGAAVALDVVSNASGGVAQQGAQDAGFGPTGQMIAGIVGGMVPGVGLSYVTPSTNPIGTPTGRNIAQERATAAALDADAFDRMGVRPFGPAFNQGPVASISKQLTETPLIGAPLRNAMDETFEDMAAAAHRTADGIAPGSSAERAGMALQDGLERFTTARMQDLQPDDIRAIPVPVGPRPGGGQLPVPVAANQIDPYAPVPPRMVMSQGAARDEAAAAAIRQRMGLPPMQGPASQSYRVARSGVEDLDDNQLRAVINRPASETSFLTRGEAMYERAYRMIPAMFRNNGSANPNMVAAVNLRHALGSIDDEIASQIAGQGTITGVLADRIRNGQAANFPIADLRAIRTEVGRALSNTNPLQATLNRGQLRQLYGAITRDIEIGLETIANRALQRMNDPTAGITPEVARRAVHAITAFRMADRHFARGMERIERFLGILRADSPEAASRRLAQASLDGERGNVQMVRAALHSLRPPERAEVAARVVTQLGEPVPSARGIVREVGFSPSSFLTRYRAMNDEFRDLLFTPAHRQALDDLARVAARMAEHEALANTSRTGTNSMNVTGAVGALTSVAYGNVGLPLTIGGGGVAMSVLMSRPEYVRWMIGYVRMRARVRTGTDQMVAPLLRHVGNLEIQARANPALWPAYMMVAEEAKQDTSRRH